MGASDNRASRTLEASMLERLSAITAEIASLEAERKTLTKSLAVLRKNTNKSEVGRINSDQRILIEQTILKTLKGKNELLTWKEILTEVKKIKPDINENTLRTYLHRLKQKGYIKFNNSPMGWRLDETST